MAERDLNYRYPAWRAGAGCPDSPFLITGCTRAFQESDSRHNSRVMGQSLPPSPLSSSFQPFSLYPSISLPAFFSPMYQLSSKIYRRIDPPMIRFPWSFQMLPLLCGIRYTCSRGIGNYKIFFLFELDEDLLVLWERHHDRINIKWSILMIHHLETIKISTSVLLLEAQTSMIFSREQGI